MSFVEVKQKKKKEEILKKENKPVKLRLKIDLVSYPEGWVNMII